MLLSRQGRCHQIKDTEVDKGHKEDILADFRRCPLFAVVSSFHDMDSPPLIVPLWKIRSEMTAAALLPAQGRASDQPRDGQEVALAPRLCRRRRRRSCVFERGDSVAKTFARTKEAGVAPHQISYRFAVKG
jgi:hypothetical protein